MLYAEWKYSLWIGLQCSDTDSVNTSLFIAKYITCSILRIELNYFSYIWNECRRKSSFKNKIIYVHIEIYFYIQILFPPHEKQTFHTMDSILELKL